MNKYNKILICISILLITGCATIYTESAFDSISSNHQIIAILPLKVTIDTKRIPKGLTLDMLASEEEKRGEYLASQLQSIMLQKYQKGKIKIRIQDNTNTIHLLTKSKIDITTIDNYSIEELAEILSVDAIGTGHAILSRPNSRGVAFFAALFGLFIITDDIAIDYKINDGVSGKLLWQYNHSLGTNILGSSANLEKGILKHIAKKFPYNITK